MKKRLIIIVVALALVVSLAVSVFFVIKNLGKREIKSDLYSCMNIEEAETYASENSIAHEIHDASLHLYNVMIFDYESYSVVEYDTDSGNITRIESFISFDSEADVNSSVEKIRTSLLTYIDCEEDVNFECIPIFDPDVVVSEEQFLDGTASKELFVFDDEITWNVSCNITDGYLSVRVNKSIG